MFVIYATVRESINTESIPIECRLSDGQKGAFVQVDIEHEWLAFEIAKLLSKKHVPSHVSEAEPPTLTPEDWSMTSDGLNLGPVQDDAAEADDLVTYPGLKSSPPTCVAGPSAAESEQPTVGGIEACITTSFALGLDGQASDANAELASLRSSLEAAQAQIVELQAYQMRCDDEAEAAQRDIELLRLAITEGDVRREHARADLKAARKALEPFATAANAYVGLTDSYYFTPMLTVGDLRAAARVLQSNNTT